MNNRHLKPSSSKQTQSVPRVSACGARLGQLSSREREVVEKRHLDEQPHTLSEIGRDLGVSRERIRQLELRARDKLKRVLEVA